MVWAYSFVTTRPCNGMCKTSDLFVMYNYVIVSWLREHNDFRDFAGYLNCCKCIRAGRDISVGRATCHGLHGPGIEYRWGTRFFAPVQTGPEAHPASYAMGTGQFSGVKWLGHGADHASPCSAEVKERLELYLYSPSGPSWPVLV